MPRTPRRLGLLDLVILVAALALGLAWTRGRDFWEPSFMPEKIDPAHLIVGLPPKRPLFIGILWAWYGVECVYSCVITVAVALLAINARMASPRIRRIFLQPGAAACTAVVVGLIIQSLWVMCRTLIDAVKTETSIDWRSGWESWQRVDILAGAIFIGPATVAMWSILALSGRMRCDRSGIDRIGRAVGCFWVAAMLLASAKQGVW